MKKRIITLLATIALAFTFVPAVAWAVEETVQTTSTEQTTTVDPAQLKTRLEKRKAEIKTRLTTSQKTRIVAKCKAGQGVIGNVKGKLESADGKRGQAYNSAVNNLTNLSTKLQNGGIDTAQLNTHIATLKDKIIAYTTAVNVYKEAVNDLVAMDCASDPDGFNVSLLAARTALTGVNSASTEVRTLLKDTIKPLLVTLRGQLGSTNQTSGGN